MAYMFRMPAPVHCPVEVLSKAARRFGSKYSLSGQYSQSQVPINHRVELRDGFRPEFTSLQAAVDLRVDVVVEDAKEAPYVAPVLVDYGHTKLPDV